MQGKDSIACLLRNENVQDGQNKPADPTTCDKSISVEGGIWNIRSKHRCKIDNTGIGFAGCLGSIVLSSVENFSLKNMQVFDSYVAGPKGNDVSSYGIQLSNCKDFYVYMKNITFDGEKVEDKSKLISTVNKRQDDYQFVSIGKGNGYGVVGKVEVVKD